MRKRLRATARYSRLRRTAGSQPIYWSRAGDSQGRGGEADGPSQPCSDSIRCAIGPRSTSRPPRMLAGDEFVPDLLVAEGRHEPQPQGPDDARLVWNCDRFREGQSQAPPTTSRRTPSKALAGPLGPAVPLLQL